MRRFQILGSSVVAVLGCVAGTAHATLILDSSISSSFGTTTSNTYGNDLPNAPSSIYYGQLLAAEDGVVDFYYVGNEAGYINSLLVGGTQAVSAGADTFAAPYNMVASLDVIAGQMLDFGFCTSGGNSIGSSGRCVYNDDTTSLIEQFNYPANGYGYRSIAYAALTGFDSSTLGGWSYSSALAGPTSDLWMILWDDSGARNDDNHDDLVVIAQFRTVPEPAALILLGTSILAFGAFSSVRRRRRRQ